MGATNAESMTNFVKHKSLKMFTENWENLHDALRYLICVRTKVIKERVLQKSASWTEH